jgi:phage terminase large subunit GpA-like protein
MPPSIYRESFIRGIIPPPDLMVSQHADQYRFLSQKTSPEPGQWRTSRVPYLREPMDMMSESSPARVVVLMFPTQQAKSEGGLNVVNYVMDHAPAPMMIVQPTIETAQRFSKRRLGEMIAANPRLKGRVSGKSNSGSNTILAKDFPGGFLVISGANSAASLASDPVKVLLCDEVDRWPEYLAGEGPPLSIAMERTRAFSSKKVMIFSTPTVKGKSVIEAEHGKGDQREYHVPCPHCGWKQVLKVENLVWDKDENGKDLPETVAYPCIDCGTLIYEYEKTWFMDEANGAQWIPTNPDAEPYVYSYHTNGLYAPLGFDRSWERVVRDYILAQQNSVLMQVFMNTTMALPFSGDGDSLDWERLYSRRSSYAFGVVPLGGVVLTAAVDVQQDRLEVEVKAWGRNNHNWSIMYAQYQGDTSQDDVWRELDHLLDREFEFESGGRAKIRMMMVDSGYNTQHVYRFVMRHSPRRVMAIKGRDNLQIPLDTPKRIDYKRDGVTLYTGVTIQGVGVNIIKDELFSWLKQTTPEEGSDMPRGWCYWPEYGQEFFKGLCSEQLVTKIVRGRMRYTYEPLPNQKRNEPLDLAVYNRAASISIGIDRWDESRWLTEIEQVTVQAGQPQPSSMRAKPRRHESSWLKS